MTSPAGMETKCRSCGKKIAFGKLGNGKLIPLDLVAPVYLLMPDGQAMKHQSTSLEIGAVGFFVSHFATCPFASEHSKTKKAPAHADASSEQSVAAAQSTESRSPSRADSE